MSPLRPLSPLPLLFLCACAGASGGSAEEAAEATPTGRDCAPATLSCGGGRCVAEIDNRCETPVTCQMRIESTCQNADGQMGPATAGTKKVTQLAGQKNTLEAETQCGQGAPIVTRLEALECF